MAAALSRYLLTEHVIAALMVAKSFGALRVQIEGDCLECMEALRNKPDGLNWKIAYTIDEFWGLTNDIAVCLFDFFCWIPNMQTESFYNTPMS